MPNIYITSSCIISNHIVYKNKQKVFENKQADLPEFLLTAYNNLNIKYPKFYKMDNLSKLGWLAAEFLLKENFEREKYKPEDIGIVLSNANASLDTDLKYLETVKDFPSPSLFVYTLPNIVIGEICIKNNFKGENAFFVFEQFDPNFIKQYVSNLVINNILQACICGWVDVLGENYTAALFLIEKSSNTNAMGFTTENINNIYQQHNG